MKAAVIYQAGGPENLILEERATPQPKDGEALVKIKAFGLNRSELMTRKGYSPGVKFPRILGIECVGEIVTDFSGKLQPGQKVAACMGGMGREYDGSYAQYVTLPSSIICPFTSALPWATLGALPEMFKTVYGSLFLALEIKKGETLLVRGGTSSIGLLAIQLAKNAGLHVIATSRNPTKSAFLFETGCDEVLIDDGNLHNQMNTLHKNGVDKVLELVGTATLKDSLACASPGGTVCMSGMLSEQWSLTDFAPMEFISATVKLTIYDSGQIRLPNNQFEKFIKDVETGRVVPSIGKVLPLTEIVRAHQLMESNNVTGKIVVTTEDA